MPRIHFLNVKQGDCSIIQHISDRVTMIDICKAVPIDVADEMLKMFTQSLDVID